MNVESYRELKVLEEISSHPRPTQRHLAKKLGVALGLTNLMVRRCVKKGYVKVSNIQKNRIQYLITPKGITEKTRLTYEFLDYSLYMYRMVRILLQETVSGLATAGGEDVIIFGIGEVAEVAYLTIKEIGLNLIAVIDDESVGTSFVSVPVGSSGELSSLSYDCVIVGSLSRGFPDAKQKLEKMGVLPQKILLLEQKGPQIRPVIPGLAG